MFPDYRSTKDSILPHKEVEEAIAHPLMKKKTLSSRDIMGIKKLIPLSNEEITASYTETNRS